jgi:hypothetical protein
VGPSDPQVADRPAFASLQLVADLAYVASHLPEEVLCLAAEPTDKLLVLAANAFDGVLASTSTPSNSTAASHQSWLSPCNGSRCSRTQRASLDVTRVEP